MTPMAADKILIAGDFQPDRLGASYERAFRTLGIEVVRFDITVENRHLSRWARNRWTHRAGIRSLALRRRWSLEFNAALVARARETGTRRVLLHNAEWVMPQTIRALRAQGCTVGVFHADNPFPPHYNNRPETLAAAREANVYFVWSQRLAARLRGAGINGQFLAFGWDDAVFPYQGDVPQGSWPGAVFIGNWDREREHFLDEVAASVPLRIYGSAYWGTRTSRGSRARRAWQGGQLTMADAARVLRESAVALNVLRTQHMIDGAYDGVIMRHFEVPGAGGVALSTLSTVATDLFEPGVAGAYFTTVADCIAQCRRLIADAPARLHLAQQAHERVARHHTYAHRTREVMAALEHTAAAATVGLPASGQPALVG